MRHKRQRPMAGASAQITSKSSSDCKWLVVAVKPSGVRVVVGSCPTAEAAESWAKMLRDLSLPIGGDALVERAR